MLLFSSAELVEPVARGTCILMLGSEAGAAGSMHRLVETLAGECDYPANKADRSLPAVARYYEAMTNRSRLVDRLRTWFEQDNEDDPALYHAVAALPIHRVVDMRYHDRLQAALRSAGRPWSLAVHDYDLAYADRSRVLLVKPYGSIDQPDSLVLSEDDHSRFAAEHPLLIDQLRVWAATQVMLWVGVNPADPTWQRLHTMITTGISTRHRREFALADTTAHATVWREHGVTVLPATDLAAGLADLGQAVAAMPELPGDSLPEPGTLLGRRPYKFLDFYTARDADLFFGRDQWADGLTGRILAQPLTVLFGRSGVGKTSLLLAGVLPRLAVRNCWPIYARPGDDPLAAVRTAAEEQLNVDDRAALCQITGLGAFLTAAGERLQRTPVVILDQAEECFTVVSEPVRERWVAALAQALYTSASTIRWVLSLREDFAAELDTWSARIPTLFNHTERLLPLDREAARAAIAGPATRVGVRVEDPLVAQVLDDLTIDGVSPPQLQIVCERLYQARDQDGCMTLAGYEALGGTRQILSDYVDVALAQFPRARRDLAVALLKAMVSGRETKLPLRPDEVLNPVAGDPAEKQAVLTKLVDTRLVRSLELSGERRYELAHEVLVEKVRSWIDEIEQQAHIVRDLLRQEEAAWTQFQTLPEPEKLLHIHAQRDNPYLALDSDDLLLVLRAALHTGLDPAYWIRRANEGGIAIWPILAAALKSTAEQQRIHALWALTGWPTARSLAALQQGMSASAPRVRVAAHQALYQIGSAEALAILDSSDDLRLVPAGAFTMGSEQNADEKPVHQVTLDAFFIEKYPVTHAQFAHFIDAGGYQQAQHWTRQGWRWVQQTRRTEPAYWKNERWNQPDYPVVGITWYEAWAYAHWAGRRLLTEAEWEKAARGPAGWIYPWGEQFDRDTCNTSETKIQRTTPVGHYSPQGDSFYGVTDMAGNVWEWTSSLYRPYPYSASDGRENPEAQGYRVLRGGAWFDISATARGAARYFNMPATAYSYTGCRCGVGVVSSSFSPLLDAGG